MREFVDALHAIPALAERSAELDGEFYTHTLMTLMFTPKTEPPHPFRRCLSPSAVDDRDVRRGGRRLPAHAFTTSYYADEVTTWLLAGPAAAPRPQELRCRFVFVVTATDDRWRPRWRPKKIRSTGRRFTVASICRLQPTFGHTELHRREGSRWDAMGACRRRRTPRLAVVSPARRAGQAPSGRAVPVRSTACFRPLLPPPEDATTPAAQLRSRRIRLWQARIAREEESRWTTSVDGAITTRGGIGYATAGRLWPLRARGQR
jgi:hypothetical protein